MGAISIQIMFNSGSFVFIMIRHAENMTSKGNKWKFIAFILIISSTNLYLMLDKFGIEMAIYKSLMISIGYIVGTIFMAHMHERNKIKSKAKSI
jgi:hypothetical protein